MLIDTTKGNRAEAHCELEVNREAQLGQSSAAFNSYVINLDFAALHQING